MLVKSAYFCRLSIKTFRAHKGIWNPSWLMKTNFKLLDLLCTWINDIPNRYDTGNMPVLVRYLPKTPRKSKLLEQATLIN
jgi:hypothetical protein